MRKQAETAVRRIAPFIFIFPSRFAVYSTKKRVKKAFSGNVSPGPLPYLVFHSRYYTNILKMRLKVLPVASLRWLNSSDHARIARSRRRDEVNRLDRTLLVSRRWRNVNCLERTNPFGLPGTGQRPELDRPQRAFPAVFVHTAFSPHFQPFYHFCLLSSFLLVRKIHRPYNQGGSILDF